MFPIVQNHNNYVFGDDLPPPPPKPLGEGLQVTNFDQCLHTVMVIGKCTDVFRGFFWFGCGVHWRGLYGRIFPWRNISFGEEKFNEKGAEFSSITIKKKKTIKNINMEKFLTLKLKAKH